MDDLYTKGWKGGYAEGKADALRERENEERANLIPTEYQFEHEAQRRDYPGMQVRFVRMDSPFYEGIKWAVRWMGRCLTHDGEWEYEPQPSSRDDAFYARCRFDSLEEAVTLAAKAERWVNGVNINRDLHPPWSELENTDPCGVIESSPEPSGSADTLDSLVGLLRRGVEIMCNPDPLGLAQEGWINDVHDFIEANV